MERQDLRNETAWPTLIVGCAIALSFVGLTLFHRSLPTVFVIVALGVVSAWHGSLQHELLHGLAVRNRSLSTALGWPTINLWLPYTHYRQTHLQHHRDEHLTDPLEDPESWYRHPDEWSRMHAPFRALLWCNRTLAGRITVGPFLAIGGYVRSEARSLSRGSQLAVKRWLKHLASAALTIVWLRLVCELPLWEYLLGAVYLGAALTLVRSYSEHRWLPDGKTRSAMVVSRGPLSLLYLNNNLHLAHHLRPDVRWYHLPRVARELHCEEVAKTGAGTYRGYRDVLRQQLFRPLCQPVHPAVVGAVQVPSLWRRAGVEEVSQ
jgi:fatty acid desaturase